MRLGLLTSVETRHRYFVNRIRRAFPVSAVAYERIGYAPAEVDRDNLSPDEARIVAHHFAERTRQEALFFGQESDLVPDDGTCTVRRLEPGRLNTDQTCRFLKSAGVNTLVVYGTNLVKEPLLSQWSDCMINLHLGLSPYYRGTATNFYPLLNEEPEYVGATIHLLDAGIDSGPIFKHVRPVITADDGPHTIGCKAIQVGIEAMIEVLKRWERLAAVPVPQWQTPNAKLYLRRDYHPRQVVELYRKLEVGLIPRYVQRAEQTVRRIRLIE